MPDNPERTPEIRAKTPHIEFVYGDIEAVLTWDNTLLRYFDEGDGMYDHVCHKLPDGGYIAFQAKERFMDLLIAERFPSRRDPVVDEVTVQWYAHAIANDLDSL